MCHCNYIINQSGSTLTGTTKPLFGLPTSWSPEICAMYMYGIPAGVPEEKTNKQKKNDNNNNNNNNNNNGRFEISLFVDVNGLLDFKETKLP